MDRRHAVRPLPGAFSAMFLFVTMLLGVSFVPAAASRVTDDLMALYDFAEGSGVAVNDVSGVAPPLDLTIVVPGAVTWLPGGGLTLDSPTLITSGTYANKIVAAATASNSLTLEAWLIPANTTQNGPARIMTCSGSSTERNFMLGQGVWNEGGDRWSTRLRTTVTDDNGTPETATDPGTLATELTHVVVTRDGTGAVGYYLDGQLVHTDFVGGTLQNWSTEYPLSLGDELTGGRPWLGTFHLVAVYGRALDHAEVIANFNAGPRGDSPPVAPVIVSAPLTVGAVDEPFAYQVLATGQPGPTFDLAGPPAGMTIDPVSGLIDWTPAAEGVFPVVVTATNTVYADTQSFDVTVYLENPLQLEVWHGLDQRVGHLGDKQPDFNLMGNAGPAGNVSKIEYNLNGGLYKELTIGGTPGSPRLAAEGDFNADIPITQLSPGASTLTVRATGPMGLVAVETVTVTRETVGAQALPVAIDWGVTGDPQDVGQYVDGLWENQGDGLRSIRPGYDRLFLIGETDWQDYEIEVPITINEVVDAYWPGLGIIMRFAGHVAGGISGADPEAQPKYGYLPFGGLGWLRWAGGYTSQPEMHFHYGDTVAWWDGGLPPVETEKAAGEDPFGLESATVNFGPAAVTPGGTYVMRMRCETQPDLPGGEGVTLYSWKIWDELAPEPVDWSFQVTQESALALRSGGVALVAHHVDATFGDVTITSLETGTSPAGGAMPAAVVLYPNHPNPFNPATIISMDVPSATTARLGIFDLQGRRVRDLFAGVLPRGLHTFEWDGRDDAGRGSASGTYLFRFVAPGQSVTRKMMLVR